jgi:hypothetical protein
MDRNLETVVESCLAELETLEQLFGKPVHSARQESDHLHASFRDFIEQAPFLILATSGLDGLDASAKGDVGGFVRVPDEKTGPDPTRCCRLCELDEHLQYSLKQTLYRALLTIGMPTQLLGRHQRPVEFQNYSTFGREPAEVVAPHPPRRRHVLGPLLM